MEYPGIFPVILSLFTFALAGCSDSERQMHAEGFRLPNGDFALGKEIFVEFKCYQCHTVAGQTWPERESSPTLVIEIGGPDRKVRSYGELVTSIINPEHVVSPAYLETMSQAERKEKSGRSPMPSFNENMSVQQLVDLAAFLFVIYQENGADLDIE